VWNSSKYFDSILNEAEVYEKNILETSDCVCLSADWLLVILYNIFYVLNVTVI